MGPGEWACSSAAPAVSAGSPEAKSLPNSDVAVVGGGPAGLIAALALAGRGRAVTLIAPPRGPDRRATALLGRSVEILDRLGLWSALRATAEPLRTIRIVDDTERLIRAPEVRFEAAELGQDAFGWSVPNASFLAGLDAAVEAHPRVARISSPATAIRIRPDAVTIIAGGDALEVRLAVGADGRGSPTREAAGIGTRSRRYDQSAVAAEFSHTLPHDGISTEFHTAEGPFTLVPLPGKRCSLVWVASPEEAARIGALAPEALAEEIERRSQSILGRITVDGPAQVFPLSSLIADRFAADRVALVGEAAHVLPPIGAQGFNLALRDIEVLAEAVGAAGDPGAEAPLRSYDRLRRNDVRIRSAAVDALNRSLLSDFLPVQGMRGLGLFALSRIGPLRRALMRQGLGA